MKKYVNMIVITFLSPPTTPIFFSPLFFPHFFVSPLSKQNKKRIIIKKSNADVFAQ